MIRNMRTRTGRAALAAALAVALVGVVAGPAHGTATEKKKAAVVNVVVGDTAGLGGPMTMTITPSSVPAGKVKFVVQNSGTIIHEVVVLKTATAFDQMPVTKNKVSEATTVGEVSEFGKGKTKSVTLKLKKGSYVLVCNVAKHYGLGMRAALTVT
jgi:uncharacterized cupredoxin-like copper-binding protein